MKEDFQRVSTLVFLPPILAAAGISILSIAAFVGLQVWIEDVGMATGLEGLNESDVSNLYGWQSELEDWSGGIKGGTDPSIGFLSRMALRSAWLFQTWALFITPTASADSERDVNAAQNSQNSQNRGYQLAEEQIIWAMKLLRGRNKDIPRSIIRRHAELLESIGTTDALDKAFSDWKYLYENTSHESNPLEASKAALKLADLSGRLREDDLMLEFLNHALDAMKFSILDTNASSTGSGLTPLAQRHLISTYLSLSTFYSSHRHLQAAWDIQQEASDFITAYVPTPPITASVPAESLHLLYLVHRASVLSIHQAEVQYAITKDVRGCIKHLDAAASSAEAVARTLCAPSGGSDTPGPTNAPLSQSTKGSFNPFNQSKQQQAPLPDHMLLSVYQESKVLQKPAVFLLRDAWRTAMRAYVLKGMLLEADARGRTSNQGEGKNAGKGIWSRTWSWGWKRRSGNPVASSNSASEALKAYQKALFWAGTTVERGRLFGIPSEEIIGIQHKIAQLEANSRY
jgi:hypothetical protein